MLLRPTANVCAGLDQRSRRADWIDRDQNDTIVHGCGILSKQKPDCETGQKVYMTLYILRSMCLFEKMDWCGLEC